MTRPYSQAQGFLGEALAQLPEIDRLLLAHDYLSRSELSAITGKSVSWVKHRRRLAFVELRRIYKERGFDL